MAEGITLNEATVGQRVGARIGEGIDSVIDTYQETKQHISDKVTGMANKGKAIHRLNRMKFNHTKESARQMYAEAKANAVDFGMATAGAVAEGYGYVKDKVSETAGNIREGAGAVKQHISEKATGMANKGKAIHRLNRMKFNHTKESARQMYAEAKANAVDFGMATAGAVAEGYGYVKDRAFEIREGFGAAKQHISEKASSLANKGKAVHRLNRMKFNRDKEAVKQMFADAKIKATEFKHKAAEKIKGGAEAVAETSFVLAYGVGELASKGYNAAKNKINGAVESVKSEVNRRVTNVKNKINNGINNVKTKVGNGVNKVKTKVGNGVNKVKNFGKKVWKGAKTAAFVTAYVAASPVILPYKAAKWGVKKISNGVKAIRNGYKNLKNRALGITDEVAQDKDTAIKQTTTEKKVSRLNAQQVAAAWEQVRDDGNAPLYSKECDSHYSISGYADRYLEELKSGKTALSPENAQLAATFLGISMEVQDKVNHNKVVDKEERNRNIAAQLEQFGIKNPYKTEETREQEEQTQSQTPPVQDKPKEQEQPAPEKPKEQEIPSLNPEQAKLVESQLNVLKTLGQENGLKPTDDMYKGLVDMMERGFAEKGITAEQMGAIRESNPNLFPPKETEQAAPQPAQEKPRETEQPTPQPAQEKPKEVEQPTPQPAQEKPKEVEQPAPQAAPEKPKEAEQPAPQAAPEKPKEAEQPAPQPAQEKPKEVEQPAPQAAPEKPKETEQAAPQAAQAKPKEANTQQRLDELYKDTVAEIGTGQHDRNVNFRNMFKMMNGDAANDKAIVDTAKQALKNAPAEAVGLVALGISDVKGKELQKELLSTVLERNDLNYENIASIANVCGRVAQANKESDNGDLRPFMDKIEEKISEKDNQKKGIKSFFKKDKDAEYAQYARSSLETSRKTIAKYSGNAGKTITQKRGLGKEKAKAVKKREVDTQVLSNLNSHSNS